MITMEKVPLEETLHEAFKIYASRLRTFCEVVVYSASTLGVAAYLLKPVRQTELREAITRAMGTIPAPGNTSMITQKKLREERPASQFLSILLAAFWGGQWSSYRKVRTSILKKREEAECLLRELPAD